MLLKRAGLLFVVVCAIFWTSCGSSSSSSNSTISNIKDRLLFDNAVNGGLFILDIDTNPPTLYQRTVGSLSAPQQMLRAPDRSFVLIYDDSAFSLSIFNSAQETITATLPINHHTDSIVMTTDGKHAYAAVPDAPQTNPPTGAVISYDLTTGNAGSQIAVPDARRLALSSDGKSMLVFTDTGDTFYYIDLSATKLTAVPITGATLHRPYSAVFASDNTTAYVLNCGTECSDANPPSVQAVTVSPKAQTLGASVVVPGATVALLDGSTLSVAGNDLTKAIGSQGVFTTVNVSNMTVSATAAIPDGLHTLMTSFNSKTWIGSSNCTTTNCLAIVDGATVTVPASTGNVTALRPAPKKNWMYVVQGTVAGAEIYNFDADKLTFTIPYDVIGQAWDVALLDQ